MGKKSPIYLEERCIPPEERYRARALEVEVREVEQRYRRTPEVRGSRCEVAPEFCIAKGRKRARRRNFPSKRSAVTRAGRCDGCARKWCVQAFMRAHMHSLIYVEGEPDKRYSDSFFHSLCAARERGTGSRSTRGGGRVTRPSMEGRGDRVLPSPCRLLFASFLKNCPRACGPSSAVLVPCLLILSSCIGYRMLV